MGVGIVVDEKTYCLDCKKMALRLEDDPTLIGKIPELVDEIEKEYEQWVDSEDPNWMWQGRQEAQRKENLIKLITSKLERS
jgi:hypothetical protein